MKRRVKRSKYIRDCIRYYKIAKRHNDSVIDVLVDKIKSLGMKIRENLNVFSQLPAIKKVQVIIADIVRLFMAAKLVKDGALFVKIWKATEDEIAKKEQALQQNIDMIKNEAGEWEEHVQTVPRTTKVVAHIVSSLLPAFLALVHKLIQVFATRKRDYIMNQQRLELARR